MGLRNRYLRDVQHLAQCNIVLHVIPVVVYSTM